MRPFGIPSTSQLDGCCDHRVITPGEEMHRHAIAYDRVNNIKDQTELQPAQEPTPLDAHLDTVFANLDPTKERS